MRRPFFLSDSEQPGDIHLPSSSHSSSHREDPDPTDRTVGSLTILCIILLVTPGHLSNQKDTLDASSVSKGLTLKVSAGSEQLPRQRQADKH